jgi:predicted ATP-dependent serine protease
VIARLRCRLFGHRWETERECAYSAVMTLSRCRVCESWGALVEVDARPGGTAEATYGDDGAIAECRKGRE